MRGVWSTQWQQFLSTIAELDHEGNSDLDESKSLVPNNQGQIIGGGVDLGVSLGLENTGGGISGPVPRGVVRAAISAAVGAPGKVGVFLDDGAGEGGERGIGVVGDHADLETGLSVGSLKKKRKKKNGGELACFLCFAFAFAFVCLDFDLIWLFTMSRLKAP